MGISVEDAVKELQARETVFVAYSQVTKLPYVTCGEESYNDQVWLFAEEETLKEFGINEDEFKEKVDHIAELAVGDACTGSNPRPIDPAAMAKLLTCTYYGTEVDF